VGKAKKKKKKQSSKLIPKHDCKYCIFPRRKWEQMMTPALELTEEISGCSSLRKLECTTALKG
jgi:hypothetical protein